MSDPTPEAMAGHSRPLAWSAAAERLSKGGWFWLASVRPDGAPHVVPVLAAWSDPVLYVAAKTSSRKARNLAHDDRCVLTTDTGDLHVVVEGRARRLHSADELTPASAAFREIYGWSTEVRGDELDAAFGAPTSGGPPYAAFAIEPTKAFAFPADGESATPTRWLFDEPV